MKQIPNLFTLLNLFFGCCALVCVLQNGLTLYTDDEGIKYVVLPPQIWYASLFIGLAAVVDFLDGFVARLLKATSPMGKELDSLADVVSFGVAPSLIIYQFLRLSYSAQENGLDVSMIWLTPAFLLACAAAYRLAKFNLDESQQYGFKGVPTPAVGLLVASVPLIAFNANETIQGVVRNKWVLYGLVVVLCYLMVSNLPLMALKFKDFSLKNNWPKWLLLGIAVMAGIFLQWLAVPVVFICYIALSLALKK